MPKQIDWEKKDKQMQMEAANESLARSLSLANNFAKRGDLESAQEFMLQAMAELYTAKNKKIIFEDQCN